MSEQALEGLKAVLQERLGIACSFGRCVRLEAPEMILVIVGDMLVRLIPSGEPGGGVLASSTRLDEFLAVALRKET